MARHFNESNTGQENHLPHDTELLTDNYRINQFSHMRNNSPTRDGNSLTRALVGIIIAIITLASFVAIAIVVSIDKTISLDKEDEAVSSSLVHEADVKNSSQSNGFYILIVGNDSRDDDYTGRSDVLILARVDSTSSTVTLVSIPRDTMVHLTENGSINKINAAYAYYGATAAVEAVSEFAGVPISHFVKVNFTGVEHVIDLLGGVYVNVPETVNAGNGGVYIEAGGQVLDGATALAYARERYTVSGGDFGRTQAQRIIVSAIIKQVLAAPASELPGLIAGLADCVSTDYSVPDLVSLALQFQKQPTTIYSAVSPSYSYWFDGVSYVGTMYDEWRAMMLRVDAGYDPNDVNISVDESRVSNKSLGAATNAASPRDYQELANESMTTNDIAVIE